MHVLFEDREEAGARLAHALGEYFRTDAIVLGIPRGGVPVAAAVARHLELVWNVITVGKLPVPWSIEADFGAVSENGSAALNEPMIEGLQLDDLQIEEISRAVQCEVIRRTAEYRANKPLPDISGKNVILVDDGISSGYTMLAAISAVRLFSPDKIIAAAPIVSRSASHLIEQSADKCVFNIISPALPFSISDFYVILHELSDAEVIDAISEK